MISIKAIKRIAILLVGSTVLAIGVVLLVLPGPAFIVIPVGLAILAVECAWARRWLRKAREFLPNTNGAEGFSSFLVRHLKNFLEWASVPTREHQGTDRTKGQKDETRKRSASAVTG
jgi:Putative transmembrane protein (PGPGW)